MWNKTTNEQEQQTTTREKTPELDKNKQPKPAIKDLKKKQAASPNLNNKISDIQDLKLFLARKKLERATKGSSMHTVAASSTQLQNFLQSSAHSSSNGGDRTSQTKPGIPDIAAKGEKTFCWDL